MMPLDYSPPHSEEVYIVEHVQQFRADVKNAISRGNTKWTTVLNLDGHVYLLSWDANISPPLHGADP